ncbi:MAG: winged helix-turn-helix domain-containing protein [Candidatus Sigynarchaeota archaeon]
MSAIKETRSLTAAAEKLGYSYKYAWDRTQKLKDRLGEPAVETRKGGKGGGGAVSLTPTGELVLQKYNEMEDFLQKCIKKKEEIIKSGIINADSGKETIK